MRTSDDSLRASLARQARRVFEQMPDEVVDRVDMMRGFVSGRDLGGQLNKLRTLVRFRHEHDELRTALTYYRYALGLMIATRLGIPEVLAESPRTEEELAEQAGVTPRAAQTLLRILEAQGHVERDGGQWKLSEFAGHFVAPGGALSYAPLLELLATFATSLDAIVEGLRSGQRPDSLDVFSEAAQIDAMLDAVNGYLDNAGRELLKKIDMPPVRSFIVGSMGVSFSALVLHEFEQARVTYGCLEHLVQRIPRLRERWDIDPTRVDGMHHHGGQPDEDRWGDETFDLVFLTKKMILEPEDRLGEKFARKAYEVLNPGGVAILWEAVHLDDEPTPMQLAMESVLDLGVSPTGCVLTREGMRSLLQDIGYSSVEFVGCLNGETNFVVARKD